MRNPLVSFANLGEIVAVKTQMNVRIEPKLGAFLRAEAGRSGVSYNLPLNLALHFWFSKPLRWRAKKISQAINKKNT